MKTPIICIKMVKSGFHKLTLIKENETVWAAVMIYCKIIISAGQSAENSEDSHGWTLR